MKVFKGKVAVVTGGASGIGRALAEKCVQEDMKVILADVEENSLRETQEELKSIGGEVLAIRTDVSQSDEVKALADRTFTTYGEVHLLFNNAGVMGNKEQAIWERSLTDWQWGIGVNLWGIIYGVHYFVPQMLEQNSEGHIVNTASIAGLISSSSFISGGEYRTSKHGVVALTETLALDLEKRGNKLKTSILCPGLVNTRIMEAERNRPKTLHDESKDKAQVSHEMTIKAQAALQATMPTSEVAEMVFDAIRQEKFYILTHPEVKPLVQRRMEHIIYEHMPVDIS